MFIDRKRTIPWKHTIWTRKSHIHSWSVTSAETTVDVESVTSHFFNISRNRTGVIAPLQISARQTLVCTQRTPAVWSMLWVCRVYRSALLAELGLDVVHHGRGFNNGHKTKQKQHTLSACAWTCCDDQNSQNQGVLEEKNWYCSIEAGTQGAYVRFWQRQPGAECDIRRFMFFFFFQILWDPKPKELPGPLHSVNSRREYVMANGFLLFFFGSCAPCWSRLLTSQHTTE